MAVPPISLKAHPSTFTCLVPLSKSTAVDAMCWNKQSSKLMPRAFFTLMPAEGRPTYATLPAAVLGSEYASIRYCPACSDICPEVEGRIHVVCSNVMPLNVMLLTRLSRVPSIFTKVSWIGAIAFMASTFSLKRGQ